MAVVLTPNLKLVAAPGDVLVPRQLSNLPRDSVANVSQVVTVDREVLTGRAGKLPESVLAQVDTGLRLVLDL